MFKESSNLKLLAVCLAVVVLSLAGAWGIRMVLADWAGPTADPPDGMPPGPVWLQSYSAAVPHYVFQQDDIKVEKAGLGGNDPDQTGWYLSTPNVVISGGGSGTTITGGDIKTDNTVWAENFSTFGYETIVGRVEASQFCLGNGINCITAWTDEGLGLWTDEGTYIYSNNYNQFVVTDTGTIGIGTTTPNKSLHIYKDTGDNAEIDIQSTDTAGSHWGIYHDKTTDDLRFWKDDTDRLTITNTGQIKITGGSPGAGRVLTSDADGLASWQTLPVVVGASATSTGSAGGYTGANLLCNNAVDDSHVCTTTEVLNTINMGTFPSLADGNYWVSAGIPFPSFTIFMNDCSGWTSNDPSYGGVVWHLFSGENKATYKSSCDMPRKFLCCK